MMSVDRRKNLSGARKFNPPLARIGIKYIVCREAYEDSASLKWSNIQPKLANHLSEVVLLLDCCYGAQAARDSSIRKQSPIPGNVELFAACGMGEKTVAPGKTSFTSLLVDELRDQLNTYGFASVAVAHKNMASKESKLGQSAIYFPLERRSGTVRIERTGQAVSSTELVTKEAASLVLHLSMSENDRMAFEDIISWLKLNPPSTVSKITVTDITTSATAVFNFVSRGVASFRSTETRQTLQEPAKKDMWQTWTNCVSSIASLATYIRRLNALDKPAEEVKAETYQKVLNGLNTSLKPVQRVIEQSVLSSPTLDSETALLKATEDSMVKELGLVETLKLRLLAHHDGSREPTEEMRVAMDLKTDKAGDAFTKFIVQDIPPYGRVLLECRRGNSENTGRSGSSSLFMGKNMEKLAKLLSSSKSADFHTLTCLRYFHERGSTGSGLVFAIPSRSPSFAISLREIIRKIAAQYKPSLDQRLAIALKIGRAIQKWHLVDWVHQGIASHNIVFFYEPAEGVDYSNPYLCGFDYARENSAPSTGRVVEDFEHNVYRHPDRQGIPSKYHRKEHDIYAYGILLIEIGLWKLAGSLFDQQEKNTMSAYLMGQKILTAAGELAHKMGDSYDQAARVCLTGEFGVDQDDKMQSRLGAAFETQVMARLRLGVSPKEL